MSSVEMRGYPSPHTPGDESDKNTTVREKPKEPGMVDKVINAVLEVNPKGKLLAIGAIALGVLALVWLLPNMMHIDVTSSQTSMNSLPVFITVATVIVVGLVGLAKHNSKNKMLSSAWTVAKAILPVLLSGFAIWWGAHTLRVLIDQGNFATGPFWFAGLALGAGAYNAIDIVGSLLIRRKRIG